MIDDRSSTSLEAMVFDLEIRSLEDRDPVIVNALNLLLASH